MRRSVAFGLIAVVATASAASGQTPAAFPLELEWSAPLACGSAEQVRAELERIAHVRPGLHLTELAARAQVEHRGAGFTVTLYTEHDGESGERKLEASDCNTLVRTVTLVLALAFGAGVEVADESAAQSAAADTGSRDAQASATAPEAPAQTAATENQSAGKDSKNDRLDHPGSANDDSGTNNATDNDASVGDDGTADAHRGATNLALLLGGGAQFGLMPAGAFAASLGAELELGAFAFGLRSTAWPGVSTDLAPKLSAHFDGLAGQLQGCGQLAVAALTFALCADARAAALRGRSDGALVDRSATAPWYALGATAAVTWPRKNWLSVRIEAALAASLNRPRFVLENFGPVQRVPLLLPNVGALLVLTP